VHDVAVLNWCLNVQNALLMACDFKTDKLIYNVVLCVSVGGFIKENSRKETPSEMCAINNTQTCKQHTEI
jgi:hypothetical protein